MKVGSLEIDLLANIVRLQKDLARAQQLVNTSMSSIERSVSRANGVLASLGLGFGAMKIIQSADQWGQLSSRVKMATTSAQEYTQVQSRLMDISNRGYKDLSNTTELYVRSAESMRQLGYSSSQTTDMVEALTYSLVVSQADTQKSASVINAWTKSMNLGVMGLEQYQTILAGSPRLVQALSESMGVSNRELLNMVSSGGVTAERMMQVTNELKKLTDEADNMPTTVSDAMTKFNNMFMQYVGELNEAHGATRLLVDALDFLGRNLDTVCIAAGGLLALRFSLWVSNYVSGTYESILAETQRLQQLKITTAAEFEKTAAVVATTRAKLMDAEATVIAAKAEVAAALEGEALAAAKLRLAGATAARVAAEGALTAALAKNTVAQNANNSAVRQATLLSRGIGLLGGPIGILTLALTAGVFAWQKWGATGQTEISKITQGTSSLAEFRQEVEKLNRFNLTKAIVDKEAEIKDAMQELQSGFSGFAMKTNKILTDIMADENDNLTPYRESLKALWNEGEVLVDVDQKTLALIETMEKNAGVSKEQKDVLVQVADKYIQAANSVTQLSNQLNILMSVNDQVNSSLAASNPNALSEAAQKSAYDKFMYDNRSQAQRRIDEIADAKKNMGEFYNPNVEKIINDKYKPRGGRGGARSESIFSRGSADISARIEEINQLVLAYEKYGIQAESLTDGEKEIIKLEQQLTIAQKLRRGQISDGQIKELIGHNKIRVEREKLLRVMEKQIELERFASQANDDLREKALSLEFEASLAGKNSEQRRIALAGYEQEVEIRKQINQMTSEGVALTAEFIDKITEEAKERGRLAASLEEATIASEKFYGAQRDLLDEANKGADDYLVKIRAIQALMSNPDSGFTQQAANAALVGSDQELFKGTSQARDAEIYGYQQMYQRIKQLRDENAIDQSTADQLLINQQILNFQKLRQLEVDAAKFRLMAGSTSWADVQLAAISKVSDGFSTFTFGATEAMGDFCKSFTDGVADSIGKAVLESENLGEALNNVATQALEGLISALIKAGIQYAITEAMGVSMSEATTAAHVAATATQTTTSVAAVQTTSAVGTVAAGEQTAAWTPAATAASIGSFGTAAVIALGAIAAVMALTKGFKSGGYTGNVGVGEVAGVVHGQEFVNNATSTRANYPYLEAMNRGISFEELAFQALAPSLMGYQSGGYVGNAPSSSFKPTPMRAIAAQPNSSQISVNIENYGTSKEFDVDISEDRIRIIATDAAESVVKKRTPGIVSGQIRNPNSEVSKTLRNSTKTERRR